MPAEGVEDSWAFVYLPQQHRDEVEQGHDDAGDSLAVCSSPSCGFYDTGGGETGG